MYNKYYEGEIVRATEGMVRGSGGYFGNLGQLLRIAGSDTRVEIINSTFFQKKGPFHCAAHQIEKL